MSNLWPADYLRPGLAADHCADVLGGSYNVPYDPATPPIILDLGANIGAFARWAAARWPGCTLHCYEPAMANFMLLERTLATLGGLTTCHAYRQAVAERSGTANLSLVGVNCGEYSLFMGNPRDMPVETVELISAATLPRADILKIDTEGAEAAILAVLAGAGRLREFSAIMFEYHHPNYKELLPILLDAAGFKAINHRILSPSRGEFKFMRA